MEGKANVREGGNTGINCKLRASFKLLKKQAGHGEISYTTK